VRRNAWSDEDLNEFDVLVEAALREPVVAERRAIFLDGLDHALETHSCPPFECWAIDLSTEIRNDGADRVLKREQEKRRPRVPVGHDGQILGKAPRVLGRKSRNDEGETIHERRLFDYLTWEELKEKRVEFARTERAAAVDRLMVEKLLTLEERVPGTANPSEACEELGITVEDFLKEAL
jgi:hypothetical protein